MVHAAVFFANVDEQHQVSRSVLGLLVAASGQCSDKFCLIENNYTFVAGDLLLLCINRLYHRRIR
jgi:hypothetical protein